MRGKLVGVLVAAVAAGCVAPDEPGAQDEELSASTRRLLGTWNLESLESLDPFSRLVLAEVTEGGRKRLEAHVAMVPSERRDPATNRFATYGNRPAWGPLEPVMRVPAVVTLARGAVRVLVDAPHVGAREYQLVLEPDGKLAVSSRDDRARFVRVKDGVALPAYLPNDAFVTSDAASATLDDHRIAIVGGYGFVSGRGGVTGQTLVYDPTRDEWQRGGDAGQVGEAGLYARGDRLYLFGGWFPHAASAAGMGVSLPLFTTDLSARAPTWSMLPRQNLDYILSAHTGVMLGSRVFQLGGTIRQHADGVAMGPSDRVSVYDTATDVWRRLSPMPSPRTGHCAIALDARRVLALGGETKQPDFATGPRTWLHGGGALYDTETDRWTGATSAMPTPVTMPSCVRLADGRVAVLGGRTTLPGASVVWSELRTVQIYDPRTNAWSTGPSYPAVMPMGAILERGYRFEHGLPGVSARPAAGVGPDGSVYLVQADSVLRWKPGTERWLRSETIGCWGSPDDAPGC